MDHIARDLTPNTTSRKLTSSYVTFFFWVRVDAKKNILHYIEIPYVTWNYAKWQMNECVKMAVKSGDAAKWKIHIMHTSITWASIEVGVIIIGYSKCNFNIEFFSVWLLKITSAILHMTLMWFSSLQFVFFFTGCFGNEFNIRAFALKLQSAWKID